MKYYNWEDQLYDSEASPLHLFVNQPQMREIGPYKSQLTLPISNRYASKYFTVNNTLVAIYMGHTLQVFLDLLIILQHFSWTLLMQLFGMQDVEDAPLHCDGLY